MKIVTRRRFLSDSTAAGVALTAGSLALATKPARAIAANEKITLAVIGIRGRGRSHIEGFAKRPDCQVAYICDVDSQYFPACSKLVEDAARGLRHDVGDDVCGKRVVDEGKKFLALVEGV